jgi:hypothetical protein
VLDGDIVRADHRHVPDGPDSRSALHAGTARAHRARRDPPDADELPLSRAADGCKMFDEKQDECRKAVSVTPDS